MMLTSIC